MAVTDRDESRKLRKAYGWFPYATYFFLDEESATSIKISLEATGPPRRHRVSGTQQQCFQILFNININFNIFVNNCLTLLKYCQFMIVGKKNERDTSKWIPKEILHAHFGADRIPGATKIFIDYCDMPDRYFLTRDSEPILGRRRLFQFGGYAAKQYFVVEKKVYHKTLVAEGGSGMTYSILEGPILYAKIGWRVICSFYAFEAEITGSSLFTVYKRSDPFDRILIALGDIEHAEEWDNSMKFYAFDIPVPGSMRYNLQHCNRSIYSTAAALGRHRLTTEDPRAPWSFRMDFYAMPATLEDCSFTDENPDEYC